MAPKLSPGTFRIVSLSEGNPSVGVDVTKPAFQKVIVGAPVTSWVVEEVGNNTYLLRVSGYAFTGVEGTSVIASNYAKQSVEWVATYRELQGAYTILPANKIQGWTVPANTGQTNSEVVLRLIIATASIPPMFLPSQLFRFEEIDKADE